MEFIVDMYAQYFILMSTIERNIAYLAEIVIPAPF